MAVFSKQQISALELCSCQQLAHPWTSSCTLFFLDLLSCGLRGTYKYFLIMYLAQLLMKGRNLTKDYLKTEVLGFLRSTLFGAFLGTSIGASFCWLRWLLGKYYFYSIIFTPALFGGGCTIFMERPSRRFLYTFTFVQMCIEYLLRVLDTSTIVTLTRRSDTLLFMCWNGLLLMLLKDASEKTKSYWFFKPTRIDKKKNDSRCCHQGPCWIHILKITSKYISIGIGIQFLQIILTNTRLVLTKPSLILERFLFQKKTFQLGSFLGSYVGVYTFFMCLMYQYVDLHSDLQVWIAGFLAGSSYWIYPNRTIAASTITNTLQLVLQRALIRGVIPSLPLATEGVFAICCATLFQIRFLDADRCPSFINRTLSTATMGRADYIYQNMKQMVDHYFSTK